MAMRSLPARRSDHPFRAIGAGFTLLELLVVLAVLGLAASLATPALLRTVETWQRQSDIDAVMEQVRGLPGLARSDGRSLVIDDDRLASGSAPLWAPDGWTLSAPQPWRVRVDGLCGPGALRMVSDTSGLAIDIVVHAPFCQPRRPALAPATAEGGGR